jgi:NADH-quinone oxidoreductase subunit H
MCGLNATLFWGGWLPPIDWAPLLRHPRHLLVLPQDHDLLLHLQLGEGDRPALPLRSADAAGWKIFLPISLLWVFLVSGYLMIFRHGALS